MRAHGAFEAAAAVAFWFFLSLLPLLVLVGFLVGQVARSRGVDALVTPLLEVVPATAEDIVRSEVQRLAGGHAAPLAPLGVAGYLWTASSGLHNLMDLLEAANRATRRAWWKQRAIALGWVVIGLATATALAWLIVRIDSALHGPVRRAAGHVAAGVHRRDHAGFASRLHTPDLQAVTAGLMLVAGTSLLAGFYRFAVEGPRRARRPIWPGAIAAVVSWLAVSWAFSAYAVSIGDYAVYYGSLAAVAVLLVWLYLTSLSLVLGAEVNAQLEGGRRA
ncbi:MAG: YihY/virulence factor BrkB family protein [Myxococcales bacterium]|nr:YihY/virulence factor BrkB family protein [Myxococcales bacterium]